MYKYCMVPNCTNTSIKTPEKLFFNVPKDPKLRKKWYSVAKRDHKTPSSAQATKHCCEDHFDVEEDMENYVKFKLVGGRLKLKKGVLPHKFECQKPLKKKIGRPGFKKRQDIENFERILIKDIGHEDLLLHSIEVVKCEKQDSNIIRNSDPIYIPEEIDISKRTNERGEKTQAVQVNLKPKMKTKSNNMPMKWKKPIVKKKAIPNYLDPNISFTVSNSNSSDITRSFGVNASDNESNDLVIKTMNKNFFNEHMQKGAVMAISRDSKLLIGISAHCYFCIKHLQNFTGISSIEILVTLRKIRWHEPNSMLAIHFGLSESSVTEYFQKSLPKVALCLNQLIIWPSSDEIRENLPIAFRKHYSKTISIIDCFEIQIEKPSNASHQALTWSQYKSCNTIKYLISITPDGLINFISEGYGGRTPDSIIFEDSGFLDKLPQDSVIVLAARGFKNISHLLEQRGCTLLRPPSVSSSSKPTAEEVLLTKSIAPIRDHVERSIGRLRDFKIIGPHACVDISYIKCLDNIVTIACGLVNLQDCLFSNQA